MKISKKASQIETSLTRKFFNIAKQFDDVIDLTLGDPDVSPNEQIRKSACEAIMQGKTHYSANAGIISLREVLAKHIKNEYNQTVNPETEIMVSVGGMGALYISIAALVDEGDEVIVLAPYYVNYIQMIKMAGGVPVVVNTLEENGFIPTKEQIENAVTDKTVAIILNTPCNPTGAVLDDKILDEIANIAIKNDLVVITDEVYSYLIYDNKKHSSIFTRDGMRERTVLIDSLSKRFSMTGYRVGYAVAPEKVIDCMTKLQENIAACTPLPSQYAAITAYDTLVEDKSMLKTFEDRRNYIAKAINSIEGLSCKKPNSTFYLFVNIEKPGLSSLEFAEKLLNEQHVAVAPGITYGDNYDGFIRIAFTLEKDKLKQAVERITAFMKNIRS